MRKWLTSLGYIVATVVIILLILPLLLGFLAEHKCKQIIATINSTTPFSAKIVDYRRGWFDADATAEISLEKLGLPNEELYKINIVSHIIHGPILIDWTRFQFVQALINAHLSLNAAQNDWLKRSPTSEPIASAKIKFKLDGETKINFVSPKFEYQSQDNTINWQGITINSIFSTLYNQAKTQIELPGLDFSTKERSINIGQVSSTYQGKKTSDNFWLGERNIKIASFATRNDNNRIIACGDLHINSATTPAKKKNYANLNIVVAVNNLNINGGSYGQSKLDLEIDNLEQTLLTKLQQQLLSNKITPLPSGSLIDNIIAIVNNGTGVTLKEFYTTTPWGKLFADLKITFADQPKNSGFLATIMGSTINTNIKADRALFLHLMEKFYQTIPLQNTNNNPTQQAEELLADWLKSEKILTTQEDNYLRLNFEYKNNRPTINNQLFVLTTKHGS